VFGCFGFLHALAPCSESSGQTNKKGRPTPVLAFESALEAVMRRAPNP
jgi:hypothetical protein